MQFLNMISLFDNNINLEEYTFRLVRDYGGDYELEDSLMGAFIMHVKLENILGWDLNILLNGLNFSQEFNNDVLFNLIPKDQLDLLPDESIISNKMYNILELESNPFLSETKNVQLKTNSSRYTRDINTDSKDFFTGMDEDELQGWDDFFEYIDNN